MGVIWGLLLQLKAMHPAIKEDGNQNNQLKEDLPLNAWHFKTFVSLFAVWMN